MENRDYIVECLTPSLDNLHGSLIEVFTYWSEIRDNPIGPMWKNFDWLRMPRSAIPMSSVVDVQYDPLDFKYRFWGTGRTRLQGGDYTGKSIMAFYPQAIAEKAFRENKMVVDDGHGLLFNTTILKNRGSEAFEYQLIRLPFSNDGSRIDKILGVGSYDDDSFQMASRYYRTSTRISPF